MTALTLKRSLPRFCFMLAGSVLLMAGCKSSSSHIAADDAAAADSKPRKAYGIFAATVNDQFSYLFDYLPKARATLQPYGAQAIAFGADHEQLEGPEFTINIMLLEFPSLDVFKTWDSSPAYTSPKGQSVIDIRLNATTPMMSVAMEGEASTATATTASSSILEVKAFVLLNDVVTDQVAYDAYQAKADKVLATYGGRTIVRGHNIVPLEGVAKPDNLTVIEFADMDHLKTWHNSPEYQELAKERLAASTIVFMIGNNGIPPLKLPSLNMPI